MSDQTSAKDPGAIWRNQPEERLAMNLEQIVNRRTEELSSSTRSEILMSIGAALLFVAVVAWRIAPFHDRLPETWIRRRPRLGRDLAVLVSPPDLAAERLAPGRGRRRGRWNTTAKNWNGAAIICGTPGYGTGPCFWRARFWLRS